MTNSENRSGGTPTPSYLRERFCYDPVTGTLFWRVIQEDCSRHKTWNTKYADKPAGVGY
jgi:hypothetical protein